MRVLLVSVGSSGDVHPFVGLGLALKARGHSTAIVANGYFESLIRNAGLEFAPLGGRELFEEAMSHPDLWHPRRAFPTVARLGILPSLRPMFETLRDLRVEGETVVVHSSLAIGARIFQEATGTPTVSVHLQPSLFRSMTRGPRLPGLWLPDWMPNFWKRFVWWAVDRLAIDRILGPELNRFRAELGLPPVTRVMNHWWHSPQRVLCLFPEWFGEPQPDWPLQARCTGFPLYDGKGAEEVAPDIEEFLEEGDPPIVFTPGTAMFQGHDFFRESARACALLGRRGILLTRHEAQIPKDLPKGVRHFLYAPFSEVLPRASALVYHGGVGTCSQALQAGIPHLVQPLAHDQFDNAERLRRLGVGDSIPRPKYRADRAAEKLSRLLESKTVAERCQALQARLADSRPLEEACDWIEAALASPNALAAGR